MHWILRGLVIGTALAAATAAHTQDANYPSRPVRIIVPFPAGGTPDVISRLVAQKLSERWRQHVYVENLRAPAATPARRPRHARRQTATRFT